MICRERFDPLMTEMRFQMPSLCVGLENPLACKIFIDNEPKLENIQNLGIEMSPGEVREVGKFVDLHTTTTTIYFLFHSHGPLVGASSIRLGRRHLSIIRRYQTVREGRDNESNNPTYFYILKHQRQLEPLDFDL